MMRMWNAALLVLTLMVMAVATVGIAVALG